MENMSIRKCFGKKWEKCADKGRIFYKLIYIYDDVK